MHGQKKRSKKKKSTIMVQRKRTPNPMNTRKNIPRMRDNPNLNKIERSKAEVADSMNKFLELTLLKALSRKLQI